MTTVAEVSEGELAWLALDQAEVLCQRRARHLRRRCVVPSCLTVERLSEFVRKGHGGALHTCILASGAVAWVATRLYSWSLPLVYALHMSRTNVDLDDALVERVMRRYRVATKRAAIDLALRRLDLEPMSRKEALEMQGTGWEGDLDELRGSWLHETPQAS
jgi:Arc/MetJ family transcription regulator